MSDETKQTSVNAVKVTSPPPIPGGQDSHVEAMAELAALQQNKGKWGNGLTLLLVSLGLFLYLGYTEWAWEFTLLLVPILLIHELGHYVAMRIFRYKNVRMFFIPLFGAAVTGVNYNVPGWKKCVVSLMGPLPGIVLGIGLGIAGMVFNQLLLLKAASLALIVNGFNLLPFLPLDGGWVFHSVLFSRHYRLDLAFRVLAVGVMAILAVVLNTQAFTVVAIALAVGIPLAYQQARIATRLREQGFGALPAAADLVPMAAAHIIMDELQQVLKKAATPRALAQQTLHIYELLNARPPGWLASVGFIGVQGAAGVICLVFSTIFILSQNTQLSATVNEMLLPEIPLVCSTVEVWRGPEAGRVEEDRKRTILAEFKNSQAATEHFQAWTNRLPEEATVALFGKSLLIEFPADDMATFRRWRGLVKQKAVSWLEDNPESQGILRFQCRAPDAATARHIRQDLQAYFAAPEEFHLVPPWHPDDTRSPEKRMQHQMARQKYLEQRSVEKLAASEAWDKVMSNQQGHATNNNTEGERAAMAKSTLQRKQQMVQHARETGTRRYEDGVFDPYMTMTVHAREVRPTKKGGAVEDGAALAASMGQLLIGMGRHSNAVEKYSARAWMPEVMDESTIELGWVMFCRPAEGAPALVQWLCERGCTDFKYAIVKPAVEHNLEEETNLRVR